MGCKGCLYGCLLYKQWYCKAGAGTELVGEAPWWDYDGCDRFAPK